MEERFPDRFPEQPLHLLKSEQKKPSKEEVKWKITRAIKDEKQHPALAVIEVLNELGFRDFAGPEDIEKVCNLINNFPLDLKQEVINYFRNLVDETEYKGVLTARRWRMTHYAYSIPFWVLYKIGEKLAPPKISEFLLCYGFYFGLEKMHVNLFNDLRKSNEELWEQTITRMINDGSNRDRKILEYLTRCDSDIFLEQCGHRLRNCGSLSRFSLEDYLVYWRRFKARISFQEYNEVLWECYCHIQDLTKGKKESDRWNNDSFHYFTPFAPLFMLIENDNCVAWEELSRRIQAEDVPIGNIQSTMTGLSFKIPNNPERIPILADWYALCRRKEKDSMDSMSGPLRSAILRVGGLSVLQRIRELQTMQAYPNSDSDSPFIFNLEEGILSHSRNRHSQNDIMKMLQENKYIIKTEAGLWEATCDALEELKRSYEQGGYSSNPYWDGDSPKLEPGCHENLWPLLKEKLDRLGVSQVEEKLIRPDILDFQIEKPLEGNQTNLKICIELKVARRSYGRNRLVDPIETQLWKRYMRPERSQHGIYIVLWFKSENYPYPKDFESIDELLKLLRNRRDDLKTRERIQIEPYVIDMTR